jgi:DNA-binding transcriptional MerR regulator
MFSVSPLMLRYYEFRGLIRRRHLIGSTRVYSWADCDRIAFILKCQRAGLRLAEVKPIVKAVDDDSSALFSEAAQERCMELVERLERCKKVCDEALAELVHTHSLLSARTGSDQLAQKP